MLICTDCGKVLTDEEREWLAGRCIPCEDEWHARLGAWRRGGEDAELDAAFSVPKPISN